MRWCYVCVSCESGLFVYMASPGICLVCFADTCASWVHPVFYPIAPYRLRLPTMYLYMAVMTNPELFAYSCRAWICLGISRFYEEQCQPSSGSAWPSSPKKRLIGPLLTGGINTICITVYEAVVTDPPLLGCVIWYIGFVSHFT